VASSIGLIFAAAMHYRVKKMRDRKIIPRLRISKANHTPKLEKFPHYVGNNNVCPIFFISYTCR